MLSINFQEQLLFCNQYIYLINGHVISIATSKTSTLGHHQKKDFSTIRVHIYLITIFFRHLHFFFYLMYKLFFQYT